MFVCGIMFRHYCEFGGWQAKSAFIAQFLAFFAGTKCPAKAKVKPSSTSPK